MHLSNLHLPHMHLPRLQSRDLTLIEEIIGIAIIFALVIFFIIFLIPLMGPGIGM